MAATGRDRVASLDGMRAVALLTILAFHFGVGGLQGGFFSIDVFYVLSGFLITGLLLAEYRKRDGIRLPAFWLRRARRLLPCLFVVLIVVTLCVRYVAPPGIYPNFRMDDLSALFYFSNWWQIASSSNYFVATGPASPLTHTWSLSVEEQFYLLWPLVVVAVMHFSRRYLRGVRVILGISVAGCIASALEMALLYNPAGNTTRIYFGTDTHAQSILVGTALACAVALRQERETKRPSHAARSGSQPPSRRQRAALAALGVAGAAVIALVIATLNGTSSLTYEGAFLLCSVASAAMIISVLAAPSGLLSRFLSLRPLVLLGLISYGVYLWHFPVVVFVSPQTIGLNGFSLLVVRFVLTISVAAASFVLLERPVMHGTFWRSVKSLVPAGAAAVATVAVILIGTVPIAVASTQAPRRYSASPGAGAHQATDPPPPRVVVLGDSTALTLGVALIATAPKGTTVVNGGLWGCGLAIAANSSNAPKPELPMFQACNETSPAADLWPALDRKTVEGTAPGDVVLLATGHWETQDLLIHGRWTSILSPSFRRYEAHQLDTFIGIADSHGAHVDLCTMPAMERDYPWLGDSPGAYDIASSPVRRRLYNNLLRQVAAKYPPNKVSIIDYGSMLSPDGHYTEYLDGVQVRSTDGVHTPSYNPGNVFDGNATQNVADAFYNWLSPRLWPLIISSANGATTGAASGKDVVASSSGRSPNS